jgi:predicted dehydrogenase
VVERDEVDIVDISTPTGTHFEIASAALEAGKSVFCEKPFTLTVEEAKHLASLAADKGVTNYVNHNYRRVPAVALAKRMIEDNKLGRIYHWRGCYLQDWIMDPGVPLTWQLRRETAGAGPHYDLNSHSVDLALHLLGDIISVQAMTTNFIKERPVVDEADATAFMEASGEDQKLGEVTVEDAAFMLAQFSNGALGSFEASRFAGGRKNYNYFEIYGEYGSLAFNLERMNELQWYDRTQGDEEGGFRTIQVTEPNHPYIEGWWPPGHIIGYEHAFVHAVRDFLVARHNGEDIHPNFQDGCKVMQVLQAGLESATSGRRVSVQ